jgi:acetylornithine deacetylase
VDGGGVIDSAYLEAERRVHRAIEQLEPACAAHLQELVRIPSPIGREGDVQRVVASSMRDLGLAVDIFDIDPVRLAGAPGFNATARHYADRPCVVGVKAGAGGGRSLILNAHVDTAPVEDPSLWTFPPFSARIDDGKMYGRGAWDDKAGVAEILLVVEALSRAGVRLRGDLIVKSVVEDETTGNGSLACLERGYVADAAIIVDGTWPERFIVSHMGGIWFRIKLRGRPGHGASQGNNPADAVGPIVSALRRMVAGKNEGRDTRWGDTDRPAYLNIGRIDAGLWPGAIPNHCGIECLYGFAPPDTVDIARRDVTLTIDALAARPDWPLVDPPLVEFWGLEVSPLIGSAANGIVHLLRDAVHRLHDRPLIEHVVAGHCDLRHYTQNCWKPGIPACLYGPGGGRNAHAENEYFVIEHLGVVVRNLASTALAWCGFELAR